MINPLGFSLENYDAVGRFRDKEKEKPIDATGSYQTVAGETIQFEGARELAQFLAENSETTTSFVQQLFHQIVKQPVSAYGEDRLNQLTMYFAEQDYNIQKLLVEIATVSAMQGR